MQAVPQKRAPQHIPVAPVFSLSGRVYTTADPPLRIFVVTDPSVKMRMSGLVLSIARLDAA